MSEVDSQTSTTSTEEEKYLYLKDCTNVEAPELKGKLKVLWSLTTLKGVPLAGLGLYSSEGVESCEGELLWYLVPKCGVDVPDQGEMEVALYELHKEDLELVKEEHCKFQREVGGMRDYTSENRNEWKEKEDGSIRTIYRSEFNYGSMRVKTMGKVRVKQITNITLEGRERVQ